MDAQVTKILGHLRFAVVSSIIANDNALVSKVREASLHVANQALCSLNDCHFIHAVESWSHNRPQASSTKRQPFHKEML